MGEVLFAGSIHRTKQSQIDAARITQKSSNEAKLSLAQSQRLVQEANNTASTRVTELTNNRRKSINADNVKIATAGEQLRDQRNSQAIAIADKARGIQDAKNAAAVRLAEAAQIVQDARNERAAQDMSLQQFSQSVRNQRLLTAGGEKVNAITDNLGIALDGIGVGTIQDRLAYAEALGAASAAAAASGISGGSVDSFNTAMSINQAFNEARQAEATKQGQWQARQQKAQIMGEAIAGMDERIGVADMDRSAIIAEQDFSPILPEGVSFAPVSAQQDLFSTFADIDYSVFTPNLDYTQYVDHKKMGGVQRYLTATAAATATYFGGPQAGNAVLQASTGLQAARNGDMSGASQSFTNAFGSAMKGFSTYRAGAQSGTPASLSYAANGTPQYTAATQGTSGSAWGKSFLKPSYNSVNIK